MPHRDPATLTPERSAALLMEALRRVDAGIPDHVVDLLALRRALEGQPVKGPISLVALMKVGRRQALDRISRMARKGAGSR